ncbi:MAG: Gfo/Idh/MocA family oxidoreductase [Zavarzinella sp.]
MLNRRHFLNHSAVIAAAMAALESDLTPNLYAEDTAPAAGNKGTLRVAVVGVRGRGMSHVGGFNGANGCQIVTVCDADTGVIGKAMDAVTKKNGKAPTFVQDFRRVVEDKSIDIISIATPNHWHALMAIWAMQNGKDVYVEKPCSHNVLEGRRMVEAARKYNRICQVGTQSRSNPGMRKSIEAIHSGKIGKVHLAYGVCYKRRNSIGKTEGAQKLPATLNYDLWSGPAPVVDLKRKNLHYDWHWIWAYGNGDLGNQGVHEMDKARWGLNKSTLPKSVMSFGGRFGYEDDGETANTQLCVFDYGDSELMFEVRGLASDSPFPANMGGKKGSNFVGNIWYGDKGIVVCPNYNSGVVLDLDLNVVEKFSGGGDSMHFANFVEAVRARKQSHLNCDIEEGHQSAALCHLSNISMLSGTPANLADIKDIPGSMHIAAGAKRFMDHLVDNKIDLKTTRAMVGPVLMIDSKTERFMGNNAKANEMLTREYRKGFEVPEKV